jgi:hypothetical protein
MAEAKIMGACRQDSVFNGSQKERSVAHLLAWRVSSPTTIC